MTKVRCSTDEIRVFLSSCLAFCGETADSNRRISGHLARLRLTWRDEQAAKAATRIEPDLFAVLRHLAQLEGNCHQAIDWLERLDEYLGSGGGAQVASGSAAVRAAREGSVPGLPRDTGETLAGASGELALWSFDQVDPGQLDWGVDPEFPAQFPTHAHHGNSDAGPYRKLVAAVPAMMDHVRAGTVDSLPTDSWEFKSYEAFLRGGPVRLCVDREGRMSVDAGRHRAMAAIEARAVIPVEVVRLES